MKFVRKILGFKVMVPVMLVFLVLFIGMGTQTKEEVRTLKKESPKMEDGGNLKRRVLEPLIVPPPPPPPQRDWFKEAITYGGGLSVLVNLINFLGKLGAGLGWLWRKLHGM